MAAPEVRKLGPLIDLKQKIGDFQVGHEGEGFLFELLRLLGNRFLQGLCVRQFTLTRESIDLVQLLLEKCLRDPQPEYSAGLRAGLLAVF
jgi:hypothetical protein